MTNQPRDISHFQNAIRIKFNNPNLLKHAFIHRSYLNEADDQTTGHNERLEFLGDAVLELIVTEYLYKNFSNQEGELTNWRSAIVKGEVLSKVASQLSVGDYLYLSKGEEKSGGRTRDLILANCLEAIIGAIYLDKGYEVSKGFIAEHILSLLPEVIEKKLYLDPKSHFQELCQEKRSVTPEYRVLEESGPDHQKCFRVGVYADKEKIAEGTGSSKQKAEQSAAMKALDNWQVAGIVKY